MKFKNTKSKKVYKKAKPKQFPSNYRSIPERLNRDKTVFFVGFLAILLAILIISLDLYSNFTTQKKLNEERISVINQMSFWESEIRKRPDYRDAYFSLALLSFRLRDMDSARRNLNEALRLDPNFEKGRELEKLLENNF
ncbi:MAG: hypothetical protein HY426_00045 [Candidatus Levybacteria bacterium]|nr:hypothetical protein [Candidatus Levybacteria bacterium]